MNLADIQGVLEIVERRIHEQVSGKRLFRKAQISWIDYQRIEEVANEDPDTDDDLVVEGDFCTNPVEESAIVRFKFIFEHGAAETGFFRDEYEFTEFHRVEK